ncbi:MAG: FxLYD domain-containing protein [Paeniclostridium sordellii]|nr:FxLYD domain-containing protein [Paeniclostridium sordellii]
MKKIIVLLSSFIVTLSLVACSSNNKDGKGQDKTFIKDVKKSFNARASYVDDVESGKITLNENEYLKEAVNKEKEILSKYKDTEFDNPELGKLAKDYIDGLNKQEEALKYYTSNITKYDKLWSEGYNTRSIVLTTLVDKFGLELDKKSFEELKNNAQVVKEQNDVKSKVDEMLKNIKFEKVKQEYDWKDYEAVVQNTSGVDFESFFLDVKLLDADGVVVESIPVSPNGSWSKDQKVKLTFSTDKSFEKIEWTADYYIKE